MKRICFLVTEPEWQTPCFELAQAFDPSATVVYEMEPEADLIITAYQSDVELLISGLRRGESGLLRPFEVREKPCSKAFFKKCLYLIMSELYDRTLPWGLLTGIKPVKLTHEMIRDEVLTETQAAEAMASRYMVSSAKAALAAALAVGEMPIVYPDGRKQVDPKSVSVYLGVPICPAKCSYCSFVSTVADQKGQLAETYLSNLLIEIESLKTLILEKGLTVDTLYIGGGTPSIFSERQLERLFSALEGAVIHSGLREFTFEAGRPETTTLEKLRVMKAYGVDRICLNPQSMNPDTLMAVNRRHSPEDVFRVYDQIRQVGFNTVNMDLILGLNQESPEAFLHSLDQVIAMAPENLTVHSLAIKHGSVIHALEGHQVVQLYDEAFYQTINDHLQKADYRPYYLYRQKYTQGSGENIGYCRPGHEGIYNILMMAERQSILGIGAGSSGKVYDSEKDRFFKVFTVKDIRTYNERIHEIIERKRADYAQL